jgi:CheY-like chemotaxis protein
MKKILIADPLQEFINILQRTLSSKGLESESALSFEAVKDLSPKDYMLVLVSQRINNISAFDFIKDIQATKVPISKLPFIICSSDNSDDFFKKSLEAGFKAVLRRPYNRREVIRTVKQVLLESGCEEEAILNIPDRKNYISELERLEFLKYILNQEQSSIFPIYSSKVNSAYYYPRPTIFFGVEPGEEYAILDQLYNNKIFSRKLENKVNLCPNCSSHKINFREVCPRCASLDIHIQNVLHHFSCGYVGPADDFQGDIPEQLRCPKCNKELRHIGLDYEKPTRTFVCADCRFVFNEPDIQFNCFNCKYIGRSEDIVVSDVYIYEPTEKAYRVVEHDSFANFSLEDILCMKDYNCHSHEFFDFLLKRTIVEAREYGDQIGLIIVGIKDCSSELLKEATSWLHETKENIMEGVTITTTHRIGVLLARADRKHALKRATEIKSFLDQYPGIEKYGIMLFAPNPAELKETVDNYFEQMLMEFEKVYPRLSNEVYYEVKKEE